MVSGFTLRSKAEGQSKGLIAIGWSRVVYRSSILTAAEVSRRRGEGMNEVRSTLAAVGLSTRRT